MKTIKATIKIEFNVENDDPETIKERLHTELTDRMDEDILFEENVTYKAVEAEEDEIDPYEDIEDEGSGLENDDE